jgi:hypothetical protein
LRDIDTTVLNLLGLNNMGFICLHNGRFERPTVNGEVVREVFAIA